MAAGSVALGAAIVEKHVTLNTKDKGTDCEFSLEPHEFKLLCSDAKNAWIAIGEVGYQRMPAEE